MTITNGWRTDGRPRPAGADGEAWVLSLLASGRVGDVLAVLDSGGLPEPFAALAHADVRVRTYRTTAVELQELCTATARAPGQDPALGWWADALLAETLALELDPAGLTVADRTLAVIPTDDVLPLTALSARARLRRVAAGRVLLVPSPGVAEAAAEARTGAIADFLRCGHTDEAMLGEVAEAAAQATFLGFDPTEPLERILNYRLLLDEPRSLWPSYVDHVICVVAALCDDHGAALDARYRLASRPDVGAELGPWPAMAELVGHVVGDLDADSLAVLDDVLRRFDRRYVRILGGLMLVVANRMADAGHPEAPRRARFALHTIGLGASDQADLGLHRLRFSIASGVVPATEDILDGLRRLDVDGRPELAARFAGVLADELAARSAHEQAAVVRAWDGRSPGPRDGGEQHARVASGPGPAHDGSMPPVAAAVQIDVLAPVLTVTAAGQDVRLGWAAALLWVHLVVGEAPLHVEQVGALVWPGASLPAVRRRLNSLLHRLRQQHPEVGRLVRRTGDVVLLDRHRCELDLARFDAATGPDDGLEALCSVRGNLCHLQFPYDEVLIEARHRFTAQWIRRATDVLARDPGVRPRLAPAAAALGLDPALTSQ